MGYATSLDGVNWTKYGSNPVLARNTTSGAIDRNDLQLESVRQWNGTYWAFFGCIPTGGVYHGCMATSTDGTNWALLNRYVINTSASGWDAGHVRAGDVIVNDGRFTMFYWGCNAGCVTQAIGRADVRYIQGSTTGRIDFHSQIPRALTSLNFQGDLPPGATVQLEIRSSPDASTWTPFETLSYSGAKPSTAADRYVEWRVTMSALPGSAPPIYRGVTIGYDTYFLAGRYTSSAFESPDRLLAATVSITRAPGGGNVSLEVSFDRGTTWAPAANATRVATASANASFVYALAFQGSARLSPVVDEVTLVLQREGYPANVSLRLGLNGTDLPVSAGTVNATVNISLPSSVLNGLVRQARAVDPNATTVDVPVLVRSMHFGSVELLAPRLSFILKNPLTVSFSPVADNLTTDENTSVAFGVTYDVYPPSVPVNISWYLDGREVVGARGQATYDYVANYTSAGLRTVQCLVENGDYFFNRTWNLTVVNVNRPPVFVTISPASPLEVSHAAWTAFEGTAIDPDPEPLSYAWELDGVPLTGGGAYLNVSNWTVGVHTLNLTVRDLEASIQHRWVVTATNAWPVIDSADPATDPAFSHTSSAWFRIVASDADGDVLAFAWRLDGGSVGASLAQILVGNLSVGLHVLSVNVSDGFGRVGHSWTVNSTNAWPTIDSADPATDPAFSHTSSAWFRIVASDADGDVLAFAWQLDYVSVGASIPEILVGNLSVGLHLVSVSVSDGFGQAGRSWSVTSTNIVPAITSVDPTGPWTMSHTASAQFTVGASDPDGDALTFSWQLDGARVAGAGETLWVGNLSVGPHSLTVSVVDRYGVVSHTWDITSTDAAPRIGGVAPPPGPLALNISEFVNFIGRAGDDDGDAVLLAWVVDNATVGNGTTLLIQFGAAGFHVVKLTVPQDLRVPPVVWNVTVAPANQRPVIVSADPGASRVNLQQGAEQEFAVEVEDDGVLPITIVWYLDGTVAGNGGNYTLRTANLSVGSHNVTVQILDGDFRVERDWDIGVVGRPQVVEGPGVEWLLLAAVLAAGVVGFVLLLRLRKRGPTA
jgi:hypothetical protein